MHFVVRLKPDSPTMSRRSRAREVALQILFEDDVNPRFSKGSRGEVTLQESPVAGAGEQFTHRFPPHSVTSLMLTRR